MRSVFFFLKDEIEREKIGREKTKTAKMRKRTENIGKTQDFPPPQETRNR